jgi:hypothetical protein
MKAKFTILLIVSLFVGIWSFGQATRPPIKTNELILENIFTWQNDIIGKDSLVYFIQIDANCYKYRSLETASVWDTICFSPTASVYVIIAGDTIILIDGGDFERNDSTFQLRRDPFCNQCWEYKYSNWIEWELLYCEQTANGQFLIAKNLQPFFWMYRADNGLDWVDSLKAVIDLADTNKVMTMTSDSVWKWLPPENQRDSIIYNLVKYGNNDTIPIIDNSITNELDSFLVNGIYVVNGDNININDADSDPTNEKDFITINDVTLGNGDSTTIGSYWVKIGNDQKYYIEADELYIKPPTDFTSGFYGDIVWGSPDSSATSRPTIATYQMGAPTLNIGFLGMSYMAYSKYLMQSVGWTHLFSNSDIQFHFGGTGKYHCLDKTWSDFLTFSSGTGFGGDYVVDKNTMALHDDGYIGLWDNPRYYKEDTEFIEAKLDVLRTDSIAAAADSSVLMVIDGVISYKPLPPISSDSFYVDLYYNDGWVLPKDTLTISFYDLVNIDNEMIPDSGQVLQYNGVNWSSGIIPGSIATYNFWFGTQAEWTANTPKTYGGVVVYPQATTTIWHVKD